MDYKKISVYTKSDAVYLLTSEISELGINGFEIHDSADFEEFLQNKEKNWDYIDDDLMGLKNTETHIDLYLPENGQGAEILASLRELLERLRGKEELYGDLRLETGSVREEDWSNNWKKYYKPFYVGKRLLVKPTWEDAPNPENRQVLEIDPAGAFGTGQHHTTRLVMELMERVLKPGDKLLDLGCGSGILSIAGLLLGASTATLVDISESAVKIAGENLRQNRFDESRFNVFYGNITEDQGLREKIGTGFDMITANIVADVIISMSGFFRSFLKPGGLLIVSGIINQRLDEVLEALKRKNITILERSEKEDWNAMLCQV